MTQWQAFPSLFFKAEALSAGHGGTALVRPVSFSLAPGAALVLRGPNGVGKSTLLLTLAGLIPPLGGRLVLEGHDEEAAGPARHYCGHRNAVRARLTVAETLAFWAEINGPTGMAIGPALARVGLERLGALDAGYLSAGQQRRLALARLLVSARPLWLLDEPSAALDAAGETLLAHLLAEHLNAGGLAVIASHDALDVAEATSLFLEAA